jgi:hypothetical protein
MTMKHIKSSTAHDALDVGDPVMHAIIYNRNDSPGSQQLFLDRLWEASYPESYLKVYLKDNVGPSSALSSSQTDR